MIHLPTAQWAHLVFDILAWSGGLGVSLALYRWRLSATVGALALKVGPGYFGALVVGAVLGAWLAGSLNTLKQSAPSLSHSVAGALVGAILGVEIYKRVRDLRGSTGGVFVAPFCVGIIIGRLGCLFSGVRDGTYGAPTGLPFAVELGDGVGRHPVQLYESLAMAGFLAVYMAALAGRRDWALRRGFYALCIAYGAQRFIWEFLKPYPTVAGPFNVFHILCGGLVAYGWIYWRGDLADERRAQERALSVPQPDDQPV